LLYARFLFEAAVATNVQDAGALFTEDAANEEAAMAVGGVFFATHEGDAGMSFKETPEPGNALLEVFCLSHFPVKHPAV
jgi:hypothetical protein